MNIHVEVPPKDQVVRHSLAVRCAHKGESWTESQLGEYAKGQGVYVIHHGDSVLYVGKTDGPSMTFGWRLRREFQETASQGKHIYPKLEQLSAPPEIRVSFLILPEVHKLVYSDEVTLDEFAKIAILEQALVGIWKPAFQRPKRRRATEKKSSKRGGFAMKPADEIRHHAEIHYIQPARNRGDSHVSIRAGDIHREMRLSSRLPAVCSALGAIKFQKEQHLRLTTREGPGVGANTVFTFEILRRATK